MNALNPETTNGSSGARPNGSHVLIIGGGASGVLMAAQLLSRPERTFRVTIVEGRNMLGCGVAYSTTDPDHLLNTRVHNMSAFTDKPHHFLDWLRVRPAGEGVTEQSFVSRAIYGAYMAGILDRWSNDGGDRRLQCVKQTCLRLQETRHGVAATLDNGQILIGNMAVLATGHVQPASDPRGALSGPWSQVDPVDADGRIVIIGTGLTMVDTVLSLLKAGHRGQILSISRRGRLPHDHAVTDPMKLNLSDIPLGAPPSAILAWLRKLAEQATRRGGSWRDAVDGARPHVHRLWSSLPPTERASFLRHGATLWDIHRHRIPPASAAVIAQAMQSGQLVLQRARFLGAEIDDNGHRRIAFRPTGSQQAARLTASRVINCRGIRRDPEQHATPLIADLLQSGQARVDNQRISLDVTDDCQLIARDGTPSRRLFSVGPASRAAFWEITAIPDIREQVARLAEVFALDTLKR